MPDQPAGPRRTLAATVRAAGASSTSRHRQLQRVDETQTKINASNIVSAA